MEALLRFLGTVAAVVITVYIVPGIVVTGGWLSIVLAALVWSVITLVIRPVIKLVTLPVTILTFGLFSFVINALLFWAMAAVVPGFLVANFWSALVGALVLSVLIWLIHKVV